MPDIPQMNEIKSKEKVQRSKEIQAKKDMVCVYKYTKFRGKSGKLARVQGTKDYLCPEMDFGHYPIGKSYLLKVINI